MDKLLDFISEHLADDTTRLILDKSKWPEILEIFGHFLI